MSQKLFPVFDVPGALAENVATQRKYLPAPLWDAEAGDFVYNGARQPMYGSGYDAWVLWCIKTIQTQRWACHGYGSGAGVEAEEAFAEPDRASTESSFERTITEALLADPMGRTRIVQEFAFEWRSDSLHISCVVIGDDGNSATIDTDIKN